MSNLVNLAGVDLVWSRVWLLCRMSNVVTYLVTSLVTLSGVECGYFVWCQSCLVSYVVILSGVEYGYFAWCQLWLLRLVSDGVTLSGVECGNIVWYRLSCLICGYFTQFRVWLFLSGVVCNVVALPGVKCGYFVWGQMRLLFRLSNVVTKQRNCKTFSFCQNSE
jgi:hypothetical protein